MKKLVLAALLALPTFASASIITYDFEWEGRNGFSMTGAFSFDSASADDRFIRDSEVISLVFEGFRNGISIGSSSTANLMANFNFNFNARSERFLTGRAPGSNRGQEWNVGGPGLGFVAGHGASALVRGNGNLRGFVNRPNRLRATQRIAAVPEPGTLGLVGLALAGIGFARRKSA